MAEDQTQGPDFPGIFIQVLEKLEKCSHRCEAEEMMGGKVVVHVKLPGWVLCRVSTLKNRMNTALKYHAFIPGFFMGIESGCS